MFVSSPDVFSSKFRSKEFVDIDLVKDSRSAGTGEYASDIFSYLREAEVRRYCSESCGTSSFDFRCITQKLRG